MNPELDIMKKGNCVPKSRPDKAQDKPQLFRERCWRKLKWQIKANQCNTPTWELTRYNRPVQQELNLSLTHRPRYPHTPDHNHQITNYHHLYPLPSPHISLLTSFPRRLVSRLYAILYLLPYLLESWSSNVPFLQEPDKNCYLPLCELYMVISVGSHLFEYSFCLC